MVVERMQPRCCLLARCRHRCRQRSRTFALPSLPTKTLAALPLPLPPQLREIAPEYYDSLYAHTSWCWVLWRFLVDPNMVGGAFVLPCSGAPLHSLIAGLAGSACDDPLSACSAPHSCHALHPSMPRATPRCPCRAPGRACTA